MTLRGLIYFGIAFTTVVVLGLLSGCSTVDQHGYQGTKASQYVQYCGMGRCDGKENR